MCCKLLRIDELQKPMNTWCSHCIPGSGCGIYAARPATCREFVCGWLAGQGPDDLRPDKSRVILTRRAVDGLPGGTQEVLLVQVDPAYPEAWQRGVAGDYVEAVLDRGDPVITVTGAKQQLHTRNVVFADQLRAQ